jgi:hypothetical protein
VQFEASDKTSTHAITTHNAVWRFRLADGRGNEIGLTLKTHCNFDRSKIGEPELAKALAEALDWQFPSE